MTGNRVRVTNAADGAGLANGGRVGEASGSLSTTSVQFARKTVPDSLRWRLTAPDPRRDRRRNALTSIAQP
jgi:hypothetical protein